MRSGNKVSFKNMGSSSPAKQDYNTNLEGADDSVGKNFRAAQTKKMELANAKEEARLAVENTPDAKYKKKGAYSDKNRGGNTLEDLKKKNIREEKESRAADDDLTNDYNRTEWDPASGVDYDPDLGHYKSDAQRKDDAKTRSAQTDLNTETRNENAKTTKKGNKENDVTEQRTKENSNWLGRTFLGKTRKYTKAERESDKVLKESNKAKTKDEKTSDRDKQLADKITTEKGTGKSGFGFDWKKMLYGGDIASGISYGAKHKNTKKTIDRRAKNKKGENIKKKGDKNRSNLTPK